MRRANPYGGANLQNYLPLCPATSGTHEAYDSLITVGQRANSTAILPFIRYAGQFNARCQFSYLIA